MASQIEKTSADAGSTVDSEGSKRQSIPSNEQAVAQPTVTVDESGAALCYANFCRVTGTPEELILDFGLNSQPIGGETRIEIKQRLVVNYFTAKRLLQALGLS